LFTKNLENIIAKSVSLYSKVCTNADALSDIRLKEDPNDTRDNTANNSRIPLSQGLFGSIITEIGQIGIRQTCFF
jgi:hypothetical protein